MKPLTLNGDSHEHTSRRHSLVRVLPYIDDRHDCHALIQCSLQSLLLGTRGPSSCDIDLISSLASLRSLIRLLIMADLIRLQQCVQMIGGFVWLGTLKQAHQRKLTDPMTCLPVANVSEWLPSQDCHASNPSAIPGLLVSCLDCGLRKLNDGFISGGPSPKFRNKILHVILAPASIHASKSGVAIRFLQPSL